MALEDKNLKSDLKKKIPNNSEGIEFQIAQSLDENDLNNLSNSPSLEALSPDENIEDSRGTPEESFPVNNNLISTSNDTEQIINSDELEGLANNAAPQEGFTDDISEENIVGTEVSPSEDTLQGSPAQGPTNIEDSSSVESNLQDIPPETSEQFGAPGTSISDSLENID